MWGSETAETNLRTMLFPCYLQLLGVDVGERDCGDESADDAVPMLFAAVASVGVWHLCTYKLLTLYLSCT